MRNTNETNKNEGYKDIVAELKKKGSKIHDLATAGRTSKLRMQLKFVDSFAAILAITGIVIQYYLVKSI